MKRLCGVLLMVFALFTNSQAAEFDGYIAHAQFTSNVIDHLPSDDITSVQTGERISFFTDLRNMEGETIRHRWLQEGEELFSMDFHIGGQRWRVWSEKNIYDWNVGEMELVVENANGSVLFRKTINVIE